MKVLRFSMLILLTGLLLLFAACPPPTPPEQQPSPEPTAEPTPTPPPAAPTAAPLILDILPFQSIATRGAVDWEYFSIDGEDYLAVANYYDGTDQATDSAIYKWNGFTFAPHQEIPTLGAYDWEYFTINDAHYLAVANHYNPSGSTPYSTSSRIYLWDEDTGLFTSIQNITTYGAFDWQYFTIGYDHFLALANYYNGTTRLINSVIYRWNGSEFVPFQTIPTIGARDWEFFTIRDDHFLAMANHHNDSSYNVNSAVYRWENTAFNTTPLQTIPTFGAYDWEHFAIGETHYLAMANSRSDSSTMIDSRLYKWDSNAGLFIADLPIATNGAASWKHFALAENHFLAVANHHGSEYSGDSPVYHWKGNGLDIANPYSIITNKAHDWEYFSVDGNDYLAVANYRSGSASSTVNTNSQIYRLSY